MGWKGTLRAIEADYHRAQRNAARRRRELLREQKEQAHRDELQQAAHGVEVYENHVEVLTSLHKDCSEPLDWKAIVHQPRPEEPAPVHASEDAARVVLEKYAPNFFIKLLGLTNWRRKRFERAVPLGKIADDRTTARAQTQYRADATEWERQITLAKGVLAAGREAIDAVLDQAKPFAELLELGWQPKTLAFDNGELGVMLIAAGKEHMPAETKSLLKTGKLSVKELPAAKVNDLYQEHVCSAALRVGRELLALLPFEFVVVHVISNLLNGATGHLEEAPILSVAMPRATIGGLDYEHLNCVEAMGNFVHEMSFKRNSGFERVDMVHAPGHERKSRLEMVR